MKLESGQNRIAKSKHLGYGLLRGSEGTGKLLQLYIEVFI